jgi:hypothetical protein
MMAKVLVNHRRRNKVQPPEFPKPEGGRAAPRIPKTRRRKGRTADSLAEVIELSNGEASEAESGCSSMSEVQEPMVRITRRRQIIIAPTPGPLVGRGRK